MLRQIRRAKVTIAIMVVALLTGLALWFSKGLGNAPLLPLVVGLVMNWTITAISVRRVMQLKRLLT